MRPRVDDQAGHAMITVVVIAFVLSILTLVVVQRAVRDQTSVLGQKQRERALHDADAGIDTVLYQLSEDKEYWTGDYMPASFQSTAAEEAWVRSAADTKPTTLTSTGEWAVVKPKTATGATTNLIYAVGYEPDRANAAKTRVLRVEYDFAPYSLHEEAVLSEVDLVISGNPLIQGVAGSTHTNADTVISGNPTLNGYASASGSYTASGSPNLGDAANSGGGKATQTLPDFNIREFYKYSQYDLCTDGTVRAGPGYTGVEIPGTSPCTGGVIAIATSSAFRGWKMSGSGGPEGAKWDYSGNQAFDGVYYIYQGSAKISGNPGDFGNPWLVTIVAEPSVTGCPSVGGDIDVSGNPGLRYHDTAEPLLLIAGRDLKISGNSETSPGYEGVLLAGEQLDISGTPSIYGAFLVYGECDTTGSALDDDEPAAIRGNATITYNGDYFLPLDGPIRVISWLEL